MWKCAAGCVLFPAPIVEFPYNDCCVLLTDKFPDLREKRKKPFSLIELEARIGAVLWQSQPTSQLSRPAVIELGSIRLDTNTHQATAEG